ncbi:MAG: hypothetical protein ACXVA9_11595 [Bdellovibrionales bacterium]
MSWILRIVFFFAGQYLKGEMITRAKRRGVIAYLRALQGTRHALMIAVAAFFIFHAVLLAGFGALITGMMLLDLEHKTILLVLFGIFLTMFLVPMLVLAVAFSERLWYRVSGAEKMVEDLRAPAESEAKAA